MKSVAIIVALAGCGSSSGDVLGPFRGTVRRFVVDRLELPQTGDDATRLGDDLDNDGTVDNQLGVIFSALVSTHDASTHGADMIASGALASSVELQGDGDVAGATYFGASGDPATVMGGRWSDGAYSSNRTRTTHAAGAATIVLPIFADADPLALPLVAMELDLAQDGAGGYDGEVRGGIPIDQARTIAYAGVAQMMTDDPTAHLVFARILDTDHDGNVTTDEIANSSLLAAFLVADLHELSALSVGFAIHLAPCADGACAAGPPADTCHDRVRDGTETDVDCGGGCAPCPATASCAAPADCQTGGCDAGHCRAPTCTDGFRDGFESDVDCGAGCPTCQTGQICANNADCASAHCSAGVGTAGTCSP